MKIKAIHAAPALLIAVFLMNFGVGLLPDSAFGADTDPFIAASLLQIFVLALPAVIFCRLRGGGYMKNLRPRLPRLSHAAVMFFALLLLFFGSCGINFLMHTLFPSAAVTTSYEADGFSGGLYLVLTMAVIPAVTEEFLFRGVVTAEYESCGVPAAVVMSSLTFAMLHFSFVRLPVYLFCGLVLSVVLYVTRSIIAAMIVHMLYNTAVLFFGNLIYRVVSSQGIVMFCLFIVILICVCAIAMFGECERIYAGYGIMNLDSSYTGKRKKGSGTAGIFYSMFTPLFTVLTVLFIVIAAVSL